MSRFVLEWLRVPAAPVAAAMADIGDVCGVDGKAEGGGICSELLAGELNDKVLDCDVDDGVCLMVEPPSLPADDSIARPSAKGCCC